jgi:hypothetical protein
MAQTDEIAPPKEVVQAQKTVEDLKARREEIDQQITEASKLIRGWKAFNLAIQGKLTLPGEEVAAETAEAKPRPATRAHKGKGAELRGRIVDLLRQHPKGLPANQITAAVPDKAVSNLLSLMKKDGVLLHGGTKGSAYTLGPNAPQAETPAAPTPTEEAPALAKQETT